MTMLCLKKEECALKEMPLVVIKRLSNHSKVGMERELIDRWDCLLQSVYTKGS